jgi:hypothetical protein
MTEPKLCYECDDGQCPFCNGLCIEEETGDECGECCGSGECPECEGRGELPDTSTPEPGPEPVKEVVTNIMQRELDELRAFASSNGLRPDWHEPEQQEVSASIVGDHLDNACGTDISADAVERGHQEYVVILRSEQTFETLKVNLATLLALASR